MLPPDAARLALRSMIRHLRRAEREVHAAYDLNAHEVAGWFTVYEPELERLDTSLTVLTQAAEDELSHLRETE